jgi:hypothetical protein
VARLTDEEIRLAREVDAEIEAVEKAERGEPEQAKASEPDPESELRRDPTPLLDTEAPDIAPHLAALAEQKAKIVESFDNGEITAREYSDALEAISDRRDDLRFLRRKAEFAKEQNKRAIDAAWGNAVDRFMKTTGKGINTDARRIAFDEYVKRVTGDAAFSHLSDRAQLAKAHKLFLKDFGGSNLSAGADDPPASRGISPGDFAALDRLADSDPAAFEKRIASMSEEAREAYLER